MEQRMLSIEEAAALLSVPRQTVRDWIRKGNLAACRVGRAYIVAAEEVSRMAIVTKGASSANDKNKSRAAEFRALLRGGKPINKRSLRADWHKDSEYERRTCAQ